MFGDLADLFAMFPAPIVAGLAVAAISSLLGVFVILKRVVTAVLATLGGLCLSFSRHLPTNQAVAALACAVFGGAAGRRVTWSLMARGRGAAE